MKLNSELGCCLSLTALCVSLTGCGIPRSEVDRPPSGTGYGTKSNWVESWEASGRTTDLHYWDDQKKDHIIWRGFNNVVINNDTAVFIGQLHSESGFKGNHLFAFQPTGPVIDITAQLLELIAKERGGRFLKASPTAGVSTLNKEDQQVEIGVSSTDWDVKVKLNWNQISDIMREVKENGVVRKDRVWGTAYIEKEFKPDTQK